MFEKLFNRAQEEGEKRRAFQGVSTVGLWGQEGEGGLGAGGGVAGTTTAEGAGGTVRATEGGGELARGGDLLLSVVGVTGTAGTVSIAVAAFGTVSVSALRALSQNAGGGVVLGLECVGDDLFTEVEVLAEVLDTLGGEVPVVVLPAERLPHVSLRLQGRRQLDDVEVLDLQVLVSGGMEVLLGTKDSIYHQTINQRQEQQEQRQEGQRPSSIISSDVSLDLLSLKRTREERKTESATDA